MNVRSELVKVENRAKVAGWFLVSYAVFFLGVASMLYFVL
jgi:hypothetical protein